MKLTENSIEFATMINKSRLEDYIEIIKDEDKSEKLTMQECQICYYNAKIGGSAMTASNCQICDTDMMFGSTCVDKLCIACAKKFKLCKHCGADIRLNSNTKHTLKE